MLLTTSDLFSTRRSSVSTFLTHFNKIKKKKLSYSIKHDTFLKKADIQQNKFLTQYKPKTKTLYPILLRQTRKYFKNCLKPKQSCSSKQKKLCTFYPAH